MENSEFQRLLDGLKRIHEREIQELAKIITSRGDLYLVLQAFMDKVWSALNQLCYYSSAVTDNGNSVPMSRIIDGLTGELEKHFRELTKRDYDPPIVRRIYKR